MKHIEIHLLLIVMIGCTLFVGININGHWNLVGGYLQSYFILIKSGKATLLEIICYILLIIAHISIVSLPFLINTTYFKRFYYGHHWPMLFYSLAYMGYLLCFLSPSFCSGLYGISDKTLAYWKKINLV